MRSTSSWRQSSGRSLTLPDRTGIDGITLDGAPDQRHGGILADAEHDAIGRLARTDDEHPGGGQGAQDEAQQDAPDADESDGHDDRRDELGGVGFARSEGSVQGGANGQGEHAPAGHAEGELA